MGGPSTGTGTPKLSAWFRIFITCGSTAYQTTSWTLGSIHWIWNIKQVQGMNLTDPLKVTFSIRFWILWANKYSLQQKRMIVVLDNVVDLFENLKWPLLVSDSSEWRVHLAWNIVNFLLFILDNNGREVARFNRPFKTTCRCCTCYCPCCLQEMEITASGSTVGYILQKQDFCNPVFQICDSDKKVVLEIKGPVCVISCCGDINFEVLLSLF